MNCNVINKYLEDYFHIKFQVNNNNNEYIISFAESNDNFFYVKLTIKDDIRLTIFAEPQKYGKQFVDIINSSNKEKRQIFVEYWANLGETKVALKVNGSNVSMNSFVENQQKWNSFSLRYSISPFYEKVEDREHNILYAASSIIAMILSICEYSIIGYEEGAQVLTLSQKYERNPINRRLCLINKGYKCTVCGFDFEKSYGTIGKNFIEVHHSLPVSMMEENHIVDPIKELFPLCPNCHAMIHKKTPPYTLDELRQIMENAKNKKSKCTSQ